MQTTNAQRITALYERLCLCFGVFSSNEASSETGRPMTAAIQEINGEFTDSINAKISRYKRKYKPDHVELVYEGDTGSDGGSVMNWADVLGIYAVSTTTDPENPTDVLIVTDDKINTLREIFNRMNSVSYDVEIETEEVPAVDEHGNPIYDDDGEQVMDEEKTLTITITVSSMGYREAAQVYGFDENQNEMLREMMRPEYYPLFAELTGDIIGDGGEYGFGLDINPDLPPSELGYQIVQAAKRYIGRSYASMDCSKLARTAYLAKIALDLTAKKARDHIGYLTEELFKEQLWDHQPITDFWGIAKGKANRLSHYGIFTMRGIAEADQSLLYKIFGVDAELLIDHAWGRETCLMSDIKKYRSKSHSVSFSQILPRDYDYDEAAIVMAEMAIHGCLELYKRHVITGKLWIGIGYSRYELYPPAQASIKLKCPTQLSSIIEPAVKAKFREIVARGVPIRHLAISFCDTRDEGCEGYDLFTDWEQVDKEKTVERTVLEIRDKFGKNAVLRGINLNKAGTQRERNGFIGGHRAGYDDARATRETVHAL